MAFYRIGLARKETDFGPYLALLRGHRVDDDDTFCPFVRDISNCMFAPNRTDLQCLSTLKI